MLATVPGPTLVFSLFLEQAKHTPAPRPLHLLFLPPGTLFSPGLCMKCVLTLVSLCPHVTFLERPFVTTLYKRATLTPATLDLLPWLYFFHSIYHHLKYSIFYLFAYIWIFSPEYELPESMQMFFPLLYSQHLVLFNGMCFIDMYSINESFPHCHC